LKIGHYTPSVTAPGGIASYLRRVVAGQLDRGHEVILFNCSKIAPLSEASLFDVKIVSVNDDADLLRQVQTLKPDVLHTHTAVTIPPEQANLFRSTALVRTMHGHEAYCPSGSRYLAHPTERPCPRGCHVVGCTWGHFVNRCGSIRPRQFLDDFRRVGIEKRSAKYFLTIAHSEFARDQLIRAGYAATRIRMISCPAPTPLPKHPELSRDTVPSFLFVGRLVRDKGVHWLLKAAARIKKPFWLGIAGKGPQEPVLRRLSRQLGLEDSVHWLGWLDEIGVQAYMIQSRAVVFPSLWHEPAGLVTVEAAAVGRALISSRVGGIPQYAEKLGHALLVAPNDIEGMAAALTQLAEDPNLAAELGATGWQRLQAGELSLERHLEELEEAYRLAAAVSLPAQ
jgi:glycosyltransferase involved in cell wall biosynthesis